MNKVINIFPTPIYIDYLNRPLNQYELDYIKKCKSECYNNYGNLTSKSTYILNDLPDLKNSIEQFIYDYTYNFLDYKKSVTPYITQSWLNYMNTNEYHHRHDHPNSFISGVLYINADKNFDSIKFHKNTYMQIKPDVNKYNDYNSDDYYISVNTGQCVLFPSNLQHSVDYNKQNAERISLAFNVFLKGTLGSELYLTELKI